MRPSKPLVEPNRAAEWARERFGFTATASALPGEVDRNFLLTAEDGSRRVLKVASGDAIPLALECQLKALLHLERTDLRDLIPRIVPDLEGTPVVRARTDDGKTCHVRMVTFLDGRPMATLGEEKTGLQRSVGRLLGRVDRELASFDHPGSRRHLIWDLARVLELRPLLDALDPELRPLVAWGLDVFAERVRPRLGELRASVIHNDANDYNLLVDDGPDGRPRLRGLIDFGDMVHSFTLAELAIACAYAMLDVVNPTEVAAEVTAGYEEALPLDDLERRLLPDLIVARLCASLLMSAQSRRSSPDDDYLTISERPAAELLVKLHESGGAEPSGPRAPVRRSPEEIVEVRRRHLGPNLSLNYRRPLKIVRGKGQYLFDADGRRFLDLVNNVSHVGHCHPRVVAAGRRQMETLNTNSRYLHDALAEYIVRLTATMPSPLSVCYLVCSGTEANDLALRLARTRTGRAEIVVLDHAYHGHSPSLIEISPYKCERPGGLGLADHARKVPCPDVYRGVHRGPDAARRYAAEVRRAVRELDDAGRPVGAFMAETLIGCGGQIVPPPGFLEVCHDAARSAGGVCIADEVQVGFGRVGTHMWAFEARGVVPDIVTLGKPIGNGHPLAAVVTTREIADSFATGMEYFNTFGGNPVSCAIGLAVLDVIEEEGLQHHALQMGQRLRNGLDELAGRHEWIGDVRGQGLFIGVELVRDRERRTPAAAAAGELIERMKDRGFLLATDGPDENVIKIKPPLVLDAADVDATLEALDEVLSELGSSGPRDAASR